MLVSLQSERFRSIDLQLALITFGQSVTVNQPVSVSKISSPFQLEAAGPTPMGEAFSMLLSMLEDHEVVSSRAYRPFIILEAHNAKDIARFFRFVTLSIQATGRSITPNAPTLAQLPSVDDLDELF